MTSRHDLVFEAVPEALSVDICVIQVHLEFVEFVQLGLPDLPTGSDWKLLEC